MPNRQGSIMWQLLLGLIVLVWLSPVLWIVDVSLRTRPEIATASLTLLPRHPILTNFTDVLHATRMPEYFMNSVYIAGGAMAAGVIIASLATYVLARFQFRGRQQLLAWILSLRLTPPIAVVVPFYLMFRRAHLLDSHAGLIVAYLPITVPFAVWVLYGFMKEIPPELDEAAVIDGCTPWTAFWWIILPLSKSGVAVAAIFTFITVWNEFLLALILTGSHTKTFAVGMSEFVLSYEVQWGQLCAATVLFLVPLLAAVYLLQQHIVRGLTMGAVH
jgi:multiple sugar transport system permease protein